MTREIRHMLRAAAVAGLVLVSGRVWAASTTYTWIGTGSGNWSNPANWSGGVLPVSDRDSFLLFTGTGSGAFAANNDVSTPFATYIVNIASSATSIQLSGGPLEFVAPTVQATPPNPLYPYLTRNSGSGTLNIANDLIVSSDLTVNNFSTTVPITFSGVISGSAKLKFYDGYFKFTSPHTIAGGVDASNGEIQVLGAGNLGTGPIHIGGGATNIGDHFTFDSAANVASGDGSITIDSGLAYITFNTLNQAALNRINPASHGTLALTGDSSANLDFSNLPGMRLGTWFPGTAAGSVAPGRAVYSGNIIPGNNTWRFGGMDPGASDFSNSDLLVVSSLLTDGPSLQGRSVSIEGVGGSTRGGRVRLTNVNNSYSGGTIIQATGSLGSASTVGNSFTGLSFDYTPAPGQTPLGTGDVIVNGSLIFEGAAGAVGALPNNFIFKQGSRLVFSNALGNNPYQLFDGVDRWGDTKPIALDTSEIRFYSRGTAANEQVGQVSFAGLSFITVDWQGTSGSTTFRASSFARTGRGTLLLYGSKSLQFSVGDRFGVTDASSITDANGIVYPYILSDDSNTASSNPHGNFVRVVGGLFQNVTPVNFNTTEDEVAHWGSSATLLADEIAWDLRMLVGFSMGISSGKTVTLKGGGLIIGGNTSNDTIIGGNLKFDNHGTPVEAVIYNNNDASITSNLIGSAGLTKWGSGILTLRPQGNNLGLGGTITVNQGYLKLGNALALNNQPVVLNNTGGLDIGGFDFTLDSITGRGIINNSASTMKTFTFNTLVDSEFAGTIGSVAFGIRMAMMKTGPGQLIMSGQNQCAGPTTVAEGTLTMTGTQGFNPTTNGPITGDFFTAAGANLNFNSNYTVLNLLGSGNTSIGPGVTFNANRLLQGSLALASGAKVTVTQNGTTTGTSSLSALNIAGSSDNWQASLDLKNNSLVVDGGDLQQITNQIRAGLLNGSGITSSAGIANRRLGAILNNSGAGAIYNTFDGIGGLDGNEVLVKYTIIGDLNLDGTVSIADFIDLAAHFNTPSGATWQVGDVNGDGAVSIGDFIDLASNFGKNLAGEAMPILPQEQAVLDNFTAANVPEPSTALSIAALAGVAIGRRRRR